MHRIGICIFLIEIQTVSPGWGLGERPDNLLFESARRARCRCCTRAPSVLDQERRTHEHSDCFGVENICNTAFAFYFYVYAGSLEEEAKKEIMDFYFNKGLITKCGSDLYSYWG